MKVNAIHNFNLQTEEEFLSIQNQLRTELQINRVLNVEDVRRCAGVDIAYWEDEGASFGVCSIVIIDRDTGEVIERLGRRDRSHVPDLAPVSMKVKNQITE